MDQLIRPPDVRCRLFALIDPSVEQQNEEITDWSTAWQIAEQRSLQSEPLRELRTHPVEPGTILPSDLTLEIVDKFARRLGLSYQLPADLKDHLSALNSSTRVREVKLIVEQIEHTLRDAPKDTVPLHLFEDLQSGNAEVQPVDAAEYRRLLCMKSEFDPENKYLGESVAILRVFERVNILESQEASTEKPILFLGPTGCGKTEIAELIHRHSSRHDQSFHREQAFDNMAFDMTMLKGRWAGYGREHGIHGINRDGLSGLLQKHNGGTIFVDEIAGAPSEFQGFLLDVLDRMPIPPTVGQAESTIPNVRLFFATNRNLDELVQAGSFRHDLYDRIRRREVLIPPLKNRVEDVFTFVRALAGGQKVDPGFYLCLLQYRWPGNVRELLDVLQAAQGRASQTQSLRMEHLALENPQIIRHVQAMSSEERERELYQLLARIVENQGLIKGQGRNARMAAILKVSQPTVSRKTIQYVDIN